MLLFYLCNPPFVGYFYSIPTEGSYLIVNKNLVEIGALLVILTTGSGQFAGLDRLVRALFRAEAEARDGVVAVPQVALRRQIRGSSELTAGG